MQDKLPGKGHLERLRGAELEAVRGWFMPGSRVLEIGGGSGYQAGIIASWGCDVVSLDIKRPASEGRYYPVDEYDGSNLVFPDDSFDMVFSSNVLEHVQDLAVLLKEIRRVLKPEGYALHILPSPAWRFWTGISFYVYLIRRLLAFRDAPGEAENNYNYNAVNKRSTAHLLNRAFFGGPHGVYPDALSELYYFSRGRWSRLFKENGFEMLNITCNGIFYTGQELCTGLSLKTRRRMAVIAGSACNVFVMRKAAFSS